jgi:hypothetical protein
MLLLHPYVFFSIGKQLSFFEAFFDSLNINILDNRLNSKLLNFCLSIVSFCSINSFFSL